ncbi:hypothetical protein FACS189463_1490 [Bacteroidia bacterium]|nr:hypothetical protein FACS189463_1490 [Bacteroidia bacterium]
MKTRIILVAAICLLGVQTVSAQNLKILSYNIYKGMTFDTSEDKVDFVEWVKALSPDIVALEEVNDFTQAKLESLARKYEHPYAILLKEKGFPVALTSKYPIVNARKVTDNMHHGFIQAQILDFNILVTHLSPHKYWKRGEEIDLILSTINHTNPEEKWIVAGDFNAYSPLDSLGYQDGLLKERIMMYEKKYQSHENLKDNNIDYSVIQKVLDFGFYDALKLKNDTYISTAPTLEETYMESNNATFRIDYIFVSKNLKNQVLNCSVIKDEFTDHKSDHYPVFLELRNNHE